MFLVFSNFDFQFLTMTSRGGQYFYRFPSACRLIEYNSSIVVRGYEQDEYMEDIYSTVASMQTLKLLLAFCNQNKYLIDQMGVETAFLNSKIKSEVYVKQSDYDKTQAF